MSFSTFPLHSFSHLCFLFTSSLSHSHSILHLFFFSSLVLWLMTLTLHFMTSYDLIWCLMTIPLYCYLSLVLHSVSLTQNKNNRFPLDFLDTLLTIQDYWNEVSSSILSSSWSLILLLLFLGVVNLLEMLSTDILIVCAVTRLFWATTSASWKLTFPLL